MKKVVKMLLYIFLSSCIMSSVFVAESASVVYPEEINAAHHAMLVGQAFSLYDLSSDDQNDVNFAIDFKKVCAVPIIKRYLFLEKYISNKQLIAGWQFRPILACVGKSDWKHCSKKMLVGMFAYNSEQKTIIMSFRGSKRLLDWFHNLNFKKKQPFFINDMSMKVHAGYLAILKNAADAINNIIKELRLQHQMDDWQVVVTGHSLGGAVATLAAGYMRTVLTELTNIKLFTFGAPPVGCAFFNSWLATQNIITTAFHHSGDPAPFNPTCRGLVFPEPIVILKPQKRFFFLKAHAMSRYLQTLYERGNIPPENRLIFTKFVFSRQPFTKK